MIKHRAYPLKMNAYDTNMNTFFLKMLCLYLDYPQYCSQNLQYVKYMYTKLNSIAKGMATYHDK